MQGDVRRSQALRSSSKIGIVNTKGSGNHGKGNDASVFEKLKPGSLRPDEHHTDESATEVDKTDAARQTVIPGQKETQTQDTESRDESVKEELNSILKRSPSKHAISHLIHGVGLLLLRLRSIRWPIYICFEACLFMLG